MSKIKKNFILEGLEVTDTSSEGKAVARYDQMVVFIDGAVPGDTVDVIVHRKKNSYAEGKAINIVKPSEHRTQPACEHFGTCGGCKWQSLNYQQQLIYKEKYVKDAFDRIGKLSYPFIEPILANEKPYFYRNKLEFSFSNKKWLTVEEIKSNAPIENRNALGFHIPGLFDKILDIENCYLQAEPSNAIRLFVRDYSLRNGLTFFDIREKSGFLRTLLIRTTSTGEIMVVVSMFENREEEIKKLCAALLEAFPGITSLQYVHNPKGNDTIQDLHLKTFYGKDFILEEMEGLKYAISAKSFYQTNSEQAYELYKITRDLAALKPEDVVYDLYTGTGTIANFVARQCKKVVGIEYVEAAVADAFKNSELNGIKNTFFKAGDMKDVFTEAFVQQHGKPDVIITDPPRAGMAPEVINVILKLKPRRVVYVSCNPSTQARDLALMEDSYAIARVQPVDMFPQTAHVENVVLLNLK
jgi:23S rRNA (uracil1939-C5)-methyltransferase